MISKTERLFNYAVLSIITIVVLWPILTFLAAAVSPDRSGLPDFANIQWSNFASAWNQANFSQAMVVSLTISITAVIGQVVLAVLSGYAFGVLGVWGEKIIFPVILLGMMVSTEAIIVPLYYQFKDLGLTNSILGIVLIHLGMSVPFGTFWMRAAFRALPKSLFESARLDGAGAFRMLWAIALPVIRPAIFTLILLTFMWTWNDYFLSMVFLHGENQTATVALGVFQGKNTLEINLMAAGGLIVAAPVLILYVLFQRKFISGMLQGAIKE